MLNFYDNLDKKKTYILGISGGADSMFLLDNFYHAGFGIIVAHINYQKRADSFNDEQVVVNYCKKNNLKYEILRVETAQYDKSNFQAQARIIRYNFFQKVANKTKVYNLVLAHHFNDFLETYLLQKQRKGIVEFYGLQEIRQFQKLTVYRPMLKITKDEILEYLTSNKIQYYEDYTNNLNIYSRNRVRKQINKLTPEKLTNLKLEIDKKNEKLNIEQQKLIKILDKTIVNGRINCKSFLLLTDKWQQKLIYNYLSKIDEKLLTESNYLKRILNILNKSNKPNIHLTLNNKWIFIKDYDGAYLSEPITKENYSYTIEKLKNFKSLHLTLKLKQEVNSMGLFVSSDEFPIYIKPNIGNERIKTKQGTKKINRLFINNKISLKERINWPVIYNCNNELIAIPMLAVDSNHLQIKNNWFMLK